MNTVKRWLAGFLSFAMIFTSAAFTNVGALNVFAEETSTIQSDSVVVLTIGDTTNFYNDFEEAVIEANQNDDPAKAVTMRLIQNVTVDSNQTINTPLKLYYDGKKLTNADRLEAGSIGNKGLCKGDIMTNSKKTGLSFAIHNVTREYKWDYNEFTEDWEVVQITDVCKNCGSEEVPVRGDSIYDNKTRRYQYIEDTVVLSTFDTSQGYTLVEEPDFIKDGSKIKHNADGTPQMTVKVLENNTGKILDVSTVLSVKAATDQEIYDYNKYLEWWEEPISNDDPTCDDYGNKWYHVIVTAPDNSVLYDEFRNDYQNAPKVDHKAGRIAGVQLLTRGTNGGTRGFDSYAAAFDAGKEARGDAFVKVTEEHFTANGSEFSGYYYWYWGNIIDDTGRATGNNTVTLRSVGNSYKEDGSFTYRAVKFCDFEEPWYFVFYNNNNWNQARNYYGGHYVYEEIAVQPLPDATSREEAIKGLSQADARNVNNNTNLDDLPNSTYSTCTKWNYAPKKVNYEHESTNDQGTTSTAKGTITYNFASLNKIPSAVSHVADEDTYVVEVAPTCCHEGSASFRCTICRRNNRVQPIPPTDKDHKYVIFDAVQAEKLTVNQVDPELTDTNLSGDSAHKMSYDGQTGIMTIEASCIEDGGTYKYCDAGKKWVKQSTIKAEGHKLSNIVEAGEWMNSNADFNVYDETIDYKYQATITCGNANCKRILTVIYHSMDAPDSETDGSSNIVNKYNAIEVTDPDVGVDCRHNAKTVWKVKDVKDSKGKDITRETEKPDTAGPHTLKNLKWAWSSDFETATVSGDCSICSAKGEENAATVEKKANSDGITEFTATYGTASQKKNVYTLKGAKVTYDTSLITDGNFVGPYGEGIKGKAAELPEVTVTAFDGTTVIDPELYETYWSYDNKTRSVNVVVYWTDSVQNSSKGTIARDAVGNVITASAEPYHVEAKNQITGVQFQLYANDELTDEWENPYDPAVTYTIETKSVPSNVTVKYAVRDKKITAGVGDNQAVQKKIEALTYDLDKVEFKNVGKYYVYAQITKDGYTTYTTYAGLVEIKERKINVYVDNAEMTVGETPVLQKQAYDVSTNKRIDIDWEAEGFTFTAAGGKEFKDLSAGTYLIWVEAPNFIVANSGATGENRVGTIEVKAKTDDQKAAEAVIADLIAAGTDADKLAAAFEKFSKLTDAQKQLVKANNEANAQLAPAEKAYNDKKAAEEEAAKKAAEKKALDDAKAAANTAIASANAYASDATIKALIDALKAAIAKNDTAAIQKATADLNNAVAAKKAAPAKKKTPTAKIKTKSKSYKAKDLKKKAKTFKIKYSKTSGSGKATFKKMKGTSKKLKVSKSGKVTVKKGTKKGTYKLKVKMTVAANSKYNAKSVTKTIKVKVKK